MFNNENIDIKEYISDYKERISEYYKEKRFEDRQFGYLRIHSIDFLRGLMVILALCLLNQGLQGSINPKYGFYAGNGISYANFCFSFFIMITGMSVPFYVKKYHEYGLTLNEIIKKSLKKAGILFLIGMIYSVLFMEAKTYVRLTGPFQTIALNYIVAVLSYISLVRLKIKNNALTYVFLGISVALSSVFTVIAFSGGKDIAHGIFLSLDKSLLGGFTTGHEIDPFGILTSIASISLVFTGLAMGCVINKKKIENRKFIRFYRKSMIKENGFNYNSLKHDVWMWIRLKSIKSILSNYYRLNDQMKRIVNMLVISLFSYIFSRILCIWIPLNPYVYTVSYVLRITSYLFVIMPFIYFLLDVLRIKRFNRLVRRMGVNSLFIIFFTTAVYNIVNLIKIKSIYTNTWLHFNNWFTTDFILPFSGIDNASIYYGIIVAFIWVLLSNILVKRDIKINL